MAGWPVAKVRVRPETGTLYLDFHYRGVRCKEQTALPDTPGNRKLVEALARPVDKEIRKGTFDYASVFPDSPRAAKFEEHTPAAVGGGHADHPTPTFAEFAELSGALGIRVEHADQLAGFLTRALEYDGPALVEIDADAQLI